MTPINPEAPLTKAVVPAVVVVEIVATRWVHFALIDRDTAADVNPVLAEHLPRPVDRFYVRVLLRARQHVDVGVSVLS